MSSDSGAGDGDGEDKDSSELALGGAMKVNDNKWKVADPCARIKLDSVQSNDLIYFLFWFYFLF